MICAMSTRRMKKMARHKKMATPPSQLTNARVQAFWQTKGEPQAAEAGRKELARYLPVLESALAQSGWLAGELSLADIAYVPHLAMVAEGGFDFSPYPRMKEWLSRLQERPAWRKASELIFGRS